MFMELFSNSGFCTLLGALIGGATSVFTSLIVNGSQSKMQDEKLKSERRAEFRKEQLNELTAIESLVNRWAVSMGRFYRADLIDASKDASAAHETNMDIEANEDMRSAAAELAIRRERIMDDSLRDELKALTSGMCLYDSEKEIVPFLGEKIKAINSVTEHLGREHRKLARIYLDEE